MHHSLVTRPITVDVTVKPFRWALMLRVFLPMAFMTWLETYMNGVATGMIRIIIQVPHLKIPRAHPAAPERYYGAAGVTAAQMDYVQPCDIRFYPLQHIALWDFESAEIRYLEPVFINSFFPRCGEIYL